MVNPSKITYVVPGISEALSWANGLARFPSYSTYRHARALLSAIEVLSSAIEAQNGIEERQKSNIREAGNASENYTWRG